MQGSPHWWSPPLPPSCNAGPAPACGAAASAAGSTPGEPYSAHTAPHAYNRCNANAMAARLPKKRAAMSCARVGAPSALSNSISRIASRSPSSNKLTPRRSTPPGASHSPHTWRGCSASTRHSPPGAPLPAAMPNAAAPSPWLPCAPSPCTAASVLPPGPRSSPPGRHSDACGVSKRCRMLNCHADCSAHAAAGMRVPGARRAVRRACSDASTPDAHPSGDDASPGTSGHIHSGVSRPSSRLG
eukprot:365291-Chlamydomonas_euryale.AAC.23